MKKILAMFLACTMLLGVTACGAAEEEEVVAAATCTVEQDGVVTKMIFDAKGDVVTKITQESSVSLEGYTDDQIVEIEALIEDAKAAYADIEGVTYSAEITDDQLLETIVIPTDEDTLQAVVQAGLLPVDNEEVTQLSLENTVANLEESGWTVE